MVNRQLSKDEKEITKRVVDAKIKEIGKIIEFIKITKKHDEFTKQKREYEDFVKPFNRKKEDEEIENQLKMLNSDLKMNQESIKTAQSQLKEGVEQKKMVGV